jgi:NAD(P)H-hydrate epimerase
VPESFAVVSVAEMRALEAAAMAAGTHERVLQERAGLAVADVVEDELRDAGIERPDARIVVLVGAGNNGRDAVVAGRRLAARGCQVGMWYGSRCPLSDAERHDVRAEGIDFSVFGDDLDPWASQALHAMIQGAHWVIDGLLGVGSRGPMRPEMASVATVMRSARSGSDHQVIAVDVPSGIDADTGEVPGEVVWADVTVTFGAVKTGLLRFPAAQYVGRLVTKTIGLPSGAADRLPFRILDEGRVCSLVPARPLDAHKYKFGRVLVVAGSDRFVGAACLGSEAAARAGAGLVGVVSTESVKRVLATRLPEATYPLTLTDLDARPDETADRVAEILHEQAALLLGPGIDRSDPMDRFVRRLLAANAGAERPVPAVIDADALSLLAQWPGWWAQIGERNVLTPHAGEMARLVASDPDLGTIDGEAPWELARRAAARWQQVIVLKGPFTTVADPDGLAWIYPHSNPALATAGTGDVLAGLTAGLLAQGSPGIDAALLAVVAHALAARRVVTERHGARTLLASDLPPVVPSVLATLADSDRVR